jgi:hypothetical protein
MPAPVSDPFATAKTEFTGLGDYEGRTVIIVPQELQKNIPSTRPNAQRPTYDRVVGDVIVVDGKPDDDLGLETIPTTIEGMYISGASVVPQLRGFVKSHKPVLGVVVKKVITKGNNPAVLLDGDAVTDAARKAAAAAFAAYQEEQEDPFGSPDE